MIDLLMSVMYLFFMAVFVASVWWGTLRLMDHAAGINFRDEIDNVADDPQASAIYFGARLIALALLFSGLLRVIL